MRKGLPTTLQLLDEYEANGGHKSPCISPEVTRSLNHVMRPSHTHHPKNDATFLEWGRRTNVRNLSQEGTESCRELFEVSPGIGELVRIDVGEILASTNDRGYIHVVAGERILFEQPDGSWKKGYVSGIWRTYGGSFFYEVREVVKTVRGQDTE